MLARIRLTEVDHQAIGAVMEPAWARAIVGIHIIVARATVTARVWFTFVKFSTVEAVTRITLAATAAVLLPINAGADRVHVTRGCRAGVNLANVYSDGSVKRLRYNAIVFGFYEECIPLAIIIVTEMGLDC